MSFNTPAEAVAAADSLTTSAALLDHINARLLPGRPTYIPAWLPTRSLSNPTPSSSALKTSNCWNNSASAWSVSSAMAQLTPSPWLARG
ncbi:MAG: hypothetical protein IPL78_34270 [Chloroflexi bacterium]|nr:hypothetical protein [Chloroflexota bacterium]